MRIVPGVGDGDTGLFDGGEQGLVRFLGGFLGALPTGGFAEAGIVPDQAAVQRRLARRAGGFDAALSALRVQYADREALRVFYQVSARPLYTVSGEHYVSELIVACGGQNIFGELGELAPAVDVEAVLDRDPEVILVSGDAGGDAFIEWSRWPDVAANRLENRFRIPADQVSRPTTRVLVAGEAICDALQTARDRRLAYEVDDDR